MMHESLRTKHPKLRKAIKRLLAAAGDISPHIGEQIAESINQIAQDLEDNTAADAAPLPATLVRKAAHVRKKGLP